LLDSGSVNPHTLKQVLDVRDNALQEVDEEDLVKLVKLKTLDLRNNALSRLPPRLGLLTSLTALLLVRTSLIRNNPLLGPDSRTMSGGIWWP